MGRIGNGWSKTSMARKQDKVRTGKILAGVVVLLLVAVFFWFGVPLPEPDQDLEKTIGGDPTRSILRKGIYDRNLEPLAVSIESFSVYVKPREFADISETSRQLAGIFGYGEETLVDRLKTERGFYWLAHSISPAKAADLAALDLEGVYLARRAHRYHPGAGTVPAFIGEVKEGQGLSGIEFLYDDVLSGEGQDLVLTLDQDLQDLLKGKLAHLLSQVEAPVASYPGTRVSAVAIDPKTGEILASAMFSASGSGNEPLLSQGGAGLFSQEIRAGSLVPLFLEAALLNSGRKSSGQDGDYAARIMVPAGRKKKLGQLYDRQWQQTSGGQYVSSWLLQLAAGISEVEAAGDHVLSSIDKAAFAAALGFTADCDIERAGGRSNDSRPWADKRFLVDEGAGTSSLHLLVAVSRLFNGGRVIAPHLIRGLVDQGGNWERPFVDLGGSSVFSRDESNRFAGLILNYLAEDEYLMVAEMVSPRREDELTAVAHGGDEVLLAPSAVMAPTLIKREQSGSFDSILLAIGPLADSKLAILVRVENGIMPSTGVSPMNEMTRGYFDRALSLLGKQKNRAGGEIKHLDPQEMFGRWLATRGDSITQRGPGLGQSFIMPDLYGLSLRKALRQLQALGLKVSINGSGMIVGQQPAAGVRVKDGSCVLTARRMQGRNERTRKLNP